MLIYWVRQLLSTSTGKYWSSAAVFNQHNWAEHNWDTNWLQRHTQQPQEIQDNYKGTWNDYRHMQNILEDTQDKSKGDHREAQNEMTINKDTKQLLGDDYKETKQPQRHVEGLQRDLNDHRNKRNNYKEMWNDDKDDKDRQNGNKHKTTTKRHTTTEICNITTNRQQQQKHTKNV